MRTHDQLIAFAGTLLLAAGCPELKDPAPTIHSFTAAPPVIGPAGASVLQWSVDGATALAIDQGVGTVTGTSRPVSPQATTRYTLVATGSGGTASASVTVTVRTVSFPASAGYAAGPNPMAIASGDLNGDGFADLVVTSYNSGSFYVFLGVGDGTFRTATGGDAGPFPSQNGIVLADMNRDGKLDLVVGNRPAVGVLLGNGDGTFAARVDQPAVDGPSIAVGDLNRDGRLDVVAAFYGAADTEVFLGNGDGSLNPGVATPTVAPYLRSPVLADLDGDGKLDLIVSLQGAQEIAVRKGNGDGSFGPAATFATDRWPFPIVVADFDRDGRPDVAVATTFSGTLNVLLGNGNGTFKPATSYPAGAGPEGMIALDANGDGYLDLAVTNSTTGTVSLFLGNGDGTFQPRSDFATGTAPEGIVAGDFNRDGIPDLAVASGDGITVHLGAWH